MFRFIIRSPSGEVREHVMRADMVTLGRAPDNDVVLEGPSVSRHHARIYIWEGRCCVEDRGSANGTWVNGYRITEPVTIDSTARVDVGGFDVTLAATDEELPALRETSLPRGPRSGQPSSETSPGVARSREGSAPSISLESSGGRVISRTTPAAPTPRAESGQQARIETGVVRTLESAAYLEGLSQHVRGRRFALPVSGAITIGRLNENDIAVADDSVSRNHARIVITDRGHVEVTDLGSANGSFVNGYRVQRKHLVDGNRVRFGNVEFRLVQLPEVVAAPGGGDTRDSRDLFRWAVLFVAMFAVMAAVLIVLLLGPLRRTTEELPLPRPQSGTMAVPPAPPAPTAPPASPAPERR